MSLTAAPTVTILSLHLVGGAREKNPIGQTHSDALDQRSHTVGSACSVGHHCGREHCLFTARTAAAGRYNRRCVVVRRTADDERPGSTNPGHRTTRPGRRRSIRPNPGGRDHLGREDGRDGRRRTGRNARFDAIQPAQARDARRGRAYGRPGRRAVLHQQHRPPHSALGAGPLVCRRHRGHRALDGIQIL